MDGKMRIYLYVINLQIFSPNFLSFSCFCVLLFANMFLWPGLVCTVFIRFPTKLAVLCLIGGALAVQLAVRGKRLHLGWYRSSYVAMQISQRGGTASLHSNTRCHGPQDQSMDGPEWNQYWIQINRIEICRSYKLNVIVGVPTTKINSGGKSDH